MFHHPYPLIIVSGLVLGMAAGVVMHRSDFCTVAMFRNYFLFGETSMLRALLLLIVTIMSLFEVARLLGLLPLYPFPLLGPPSLANVIGGFLFGTGMVLAGGCVIGTLYKMGAGSLLSCLAFCGLIVGSALYAEIYPWWSSFGRATTFLPGRVTVPQMLGVTPTPLVLGVMAVALPLFLRWQRQGKWLRRASADGYLQPWRASLLLAGIGVTFCLLVGLPLGITTAYAKIGAYLESLAAPGHVASSAFFSSLSLDFIHPISNVRLTGGAGPGADAVAAIQFPLVLGIAGGGLISALLLREFRIHVRVPLRQYIAAFVGGMIMGLAARMTPACNVLHLFGGLPVFACQSILFLAGLLPGAWMGSRILVTRVVTGKAAGRAENGIRR